MTEPIFHGVHDFSYRNKEGNAEFSRGIICEIDGWFFGFRYFTLLVVLIPVELTSGAQIEQAANVTERIIVEMLIQCVDPQSGMKERVRDIIRQHGRLNTRLIKRLKGAK